MRLTSSSTHAEGIFDKKGMLAHNQSTMCFIIKNQHGTGPNWIAFSRDDINPDTNSEGADGTGYQTGAGSQANDRIFNNSFINLFLLQIDKTLL